MDIDHKLSNKISVILINLLLQLKNLANVEKDENNDLSNLEHNDQEEFSTVGNNMKPKCLSVLHLNTSSLQKF